MQRRWFRLLGLAFIASLAAAPASAVVAQRPFRFDDLASLGRISTFSMSPDGKWIVYAVTSPDVAANASRSALWLVPADGGEARRLTAGDKSDSEPRFWPDGKRIGFLSNREGGSQIWTIDLAGGEPRRATSFPTEVNTFRITPDGKWFVFASDVFPECADTACLSARLDRRAKSPVKARLAERLLFRHWDAWKEGTRTHVWKVGVDGGAATDLTPGNWDAPRFEVGGGSDFDVSPDGRELAYAVVTDPREALSTNADVWTVALAGGKPVNRTGSNPAFDGSPRYSPDGRWIAYRIQRRPGYESDRFLLALFERATGKTRVLTEELDSWVEEIAWSPDSSAIYFVSEVRARGVLMRVPIAGGGPTPVWTGGMPAHPAVSPDGRRILFSASSVTRPAEIYAVEAASRASDASGAWRAAALTHVNDAKMKSFALSAEERWTDSRDGKRLHGWVYRPPGFDSSRKYPAVLLIHGGPQGAWADSWSYRWTPQVFAGAGYVVYAANPRGSTGFGQAFTDAIRGDWGGGVYEDVMRAADDLASLPYVDAKKIGAAGASFGGYMIAWIAGHTDRFAALVCHDGISDTVSAALATEELWFPVWEFRGWPWASEDYQKWNPMRFADAFRTPTLVIHGEKDYRLPYEQGIEFFTALQVKGVPSKLLTFPDEGHWVLKPGNSRVWHATVLDWLHRWLGGAEADPKALAAVENVTK